MVWPQGNKAMCDVANAAEVDLLVSRPGCFGRAKNSARRESDFAIGLVRAGFEPFGIQLVMLTLLFGQRPDGR